MSRPDRVLFPQSGFKKSDALRYYEAVSEYLLPHLRDRPLSFQRYPDTVEGEFFWEKDAPGFTPDWVPRFSVPRRGGGDAIDYIVVNDARTLLWIVDHGGIELHPFLHVIPRVDLATHVVFDLDPGEGADIRDCARVALLLREALQVESYAKVSGSKGIQVYLPLPEPAPHTKTEPFARAVADELARRHPELIVSEMAKSLRRGKVFIDWSQNADYKTTVAAYSLRANQPWVSMPVTWEELAKPTSKLYWEPDEALKRLRKLGDLGAPTSSRPVRRSPIGADWKSADRPSRSSAFRRTSQSGRRLMLRTNDELWLDLGGTFHRWRVRGTAAHYLGESPVTRAHYAQGGEAYELIEGGLGRGRLDLWMDHCEWVLEKTKGGAWRLTSRPPAG